MIPASIPRVAIAILCARGLRALADGLIGVVLPAYLLGLGFGPLQVGVLTTATLLGSAVLTLAVGLRGTSGGFRPWLVGCSLLMAATGLGFAGLTTFIPLVVVGFIGTLNPAAGDVTPFLPLEQAALSESVADRQRTDAFVVYSLAGGLLTAVGSLAASLPDALASIAHLDRLSALRSMFGVYGAIGVAVAAIYRRLPPSQPRTSAPKARPLGKSRGIVYRLAALFSLDAFGGGLLVQSLLALWLFDRFGLSVSTVAQIFFATQLLAAASFPLAGWLARRVGLINTMVFTHIPANLCVIALPFAGDVRIAIGLLLARGLLGQMDVPTRTSYVMAVVTPEERPAASSITSVPRSLASALGPTLAGYLMSMGGSALPFILCGTLKTLYDITLLAMFRRVRAPEEPAT